MLNACSAVFLKIKQTTAVSETSPKRKTEENNQHTKIRRLEFRNSFSGSLSSCFYQPGFDFVCDIRLKQFRCWPRGKVSKKNSKQFRKTPNNKKTSHTPAASHSFLILSLVKHYQRARTLPVCSRLGTTHITTQFVPAAEAAAARSYLGRGGLSWTVQYRTGPSTRVGCEGL